MLLEDTFCSSRRFNVNPLTKRGKGSTFCCSLAKISISEGKVGNAVSTEARSEEVRREISRRHLVARALNVDSETRRELKTNVDKKYPPMQR